MLNLTIYLIIFCAVLAILIKDILLSVLSLATVSVLLAILFYQLGAPVAGAFELSVGAGLITVLIILTISFIQAKKEQKVSRNAIWKILSLAVVITLFLLLQTIVPTILPVSPISVSWGEVGKVFWKLRVFDLLPQVLIIIATVFGILTLLRTEKGGHK